MTKNELKAAVEAVLAAGKLDSFTVKNMGRELRVTVLATHPERWEVTESTRLRPVLNQLVAEGRLTKSSGTTTTHLGWNSRLSLSRKTFSYRVAR